MSLLRREMRALPLSIDPDQLTARPIGGNYAAEIVTESSSFQTTAVIAAVTLLADSIASMPVKTYKDVSGRYEQISTPMLFIAPNAEQTMFEFIHQTMVTIAIHGVDFIHVIRRGMEPIEIRNIHPSLVHVSRNKEGDIEYRIGGQPVPSDEIVQINWLCMPNQLRGLSPMESLRNTIGTSLAIERFLAQFYGDGATPSSVLETDQQMTEQQATILRETWVDSLWKRRRPAVLTGGLKWRSITASSADMETMAHREALVRDIARAYRIPLHMVNGTGGDSQTYQNVEAAGINFVRHTLLPWMRRLEDALSSLMPSGQFVRFDADELQRADLLTRVRAQQTMIMSGTLTPNEARHDLGREPYEGGDQFVLGVPGAPMASVVGGTLPTLGTDGEPPK